jgi:hypothetical protein
MDLHQLQRLGHVHTKHDIPLYLKTKLVFSAFNVCLISTQVFRDTMIGTKTPFDYELLDSIVEDGNYDLLPIGYTINGSVLSSSLHL